MRNNPRDWRIAEVEAEQNRSLTAYLEWLILQDTKKK